MSNRHSTDKIKEKQKHAESNHHKWPGTQGFHHVGPLLGFEPVTLTSGGSNDMLLQKLTL